MAYTIENTYTGNGSTVLYSFTFPYLETTDIKVTLDEVANTAWTLASATQIQFNSAPGNNVAIRIYRDTDISALQSEFFSGSAIRSQDLNNDFNQTLYVSQETEKAVEGKWNNTTDTIDSTEAFADVNTKIMTAAAIDDRINANIAVQPLANGKILAGNGSGVAAAVTPSGDLTMANTGAFTIANGAVEHAMLANDAVDGDNIADNAVNSEHYAADSIDTEHYAPNSVDTAALAADCVTGSQIADDTIDTEHYAANSVDTTALGADAVTGAQIADDAINSEHYTDGSIDTAHIADANVTLAKVENVSSGQIIVGNGSNRPTAVAMSGDATISNAGAVTIATGAVEHAMLAADAVDGDNIADDSVNSEHYVDASIDHAHLANDCVDGDNIADDAVAAEHVASNAIVNDSVAAGAAIAHSKLAAVSSGQIIVGNGSNVPTSVAMSGDVAIAAGGATTIQSNAVEIGMIGCEQTTISDSDSHIPTSGAVVDYVAAQLAPVGGFEVIANKDSFPETQPASGVVISIADAQGIVVNGSGTSTTPDTISSDATVTINNINSAFHSATVDSGVGWLVTSTGSGQIYNYHKANIKESDVVQLSDDINDFNSRYRIAGSAPGSNNDEGDLYFDTGTNKMYVYDGSAWGEVTSTGDYKFLTIKDHDQAVSGSGPTFNGSNEEFDLFDGSSDASITSAAQLLVVLNGVLQKPNSGTFSGSEEGYYLNDTHGIKFCDPPASGSTLFVTQIGSATTLQVPADNSVSEAKIQVGAVSHTRLAADCVDGDNIQDDAVGAEHIEQLDADLSFADSAKAKFGTGNDLEIFHNGSNSYIDDTGTGDLYIRGDNDLYIANSGGTETKARFNTNGAVSLYYDNSKKFETTSAGATVTGTLTATLADNSVGLAQMAGGTDGQIITYDANGDPVAVGPGTDGQVLTSTGAGSPPAFETISSSDTLSFRNVIINGAMQIDQRNNGSSHSLGQNASAYAADRVKVTNNNCGELALTLQQLNNDAPTGFKYCSKVTIATAESSGGTPAADDRCSLQFRLEGNTLDRFDLGESTARDIVISFWVKSSLTGNFGVVLTGGSTPNLQYGALYAISSADTWEKKTVKIPGPTSGTWVTSSAEGIAIKFGIYCGSNKVTSDQGVAGSGSWQSGYTAQGVTGQVQVGATGSATWQITGVQMEVGTTATDFEHRSWQDEHNACQRYYHRIGSPYGAIGDGGSFFVAYTQGSSNKYIGTHWFPQPMRGNPSAVEWSGTLAQYGGTSDSDGELVATAIGDSHTCRTSGRIHLTVSSIGGGKGGLIMSKSNSAYFAWNAEL